MSGGYENVFVDARFYNALTGEFQDPYKHVHAISKLLLDSVRDGQRQIEEDEKGSDRVNYFYNLPWLPSIGVDVYGDADETRLFVDTVTLTTTEVHDKADSLTFSSDGPRLHIEDTVGSASVHYDINERNGLMVARRDVTLAAQNFFRRNN